MLRILIVLFPIGNIYYTPLVITLSFISVIFISIIILQQIDLKKIKPDLVLSVPLHPRKKKERGYNQLHLFTETLAKINVGKLFI